LRYSKWLDTPDNPHIHDSTWLYIPDNYRLKAMTVPELKKHKATGGVENITE
jgi:hypothetical protein